MFLRVAFVCFLLMVMLSCSSSPSTVNVVNSLANKSTPTPIPTTTPPLNVQKDEKLQKQSDELLSLFDKMPQVPVYIKDEPILRTGSETQKGVGYTLCEPDNQPVIYLKKIFYQRANEKQLTNILKHELTHAYFCRQGIQAGHDERFRKKFREVGGIGN
jgi:hypothetical protein